jgi:Domain of unknown function (DUF5063)
MNDAVDEFRHAANRFCQLVESADELSRHEFLTGLDGSLPEIYGAALRLPATFDEGDEPEGISHEQWTEMFQRIRTKLGDADGYLLFFDPWDKDDPPVEASLADDVADIYRDLKRVIVDGRGEQGAWDWRFAFTQHWGDHAANALKATHWLLHRPGVRWIDPAE